MALNIQDDDDLNFQDCRVILGGITQLEEQKKYCFYEFLVIFRILILMSLVILKMKMMIPMFNIGIIIFIIVINGNKILPKGPMLTSMLALMMTMMMMMIHRCK